VNILFVANCGNCSLMAEYCDRGDEWLHYSAHLTQTPM